MHAGVFVLIILIPSVAKERQTFKEVFTTFNKPDAVGITSSPYIFLLGLLVSQYTVTGFDASAHMVNTSIPTCHNSIFEDRSTSTQMIS